MYNWLSTTYAGDDRTRAKRYLTKCSIVFGRPIPVLNITAPTPPGNKLPWYNSFLEAVNEMPVSGPQYYIDTKQFPVLENIVLQQTTIQELMESAGSPYDYLKKYSFLVSVVQNGVVKKFRYKPSQMMMVLSWTTDEKVYTQLRAAAEFETACQQFVDLTKRNGKALANLSLQTNLTTTQRNAVNLEIAKHLYTINTFSNELPPGFAFDKRSLKADVINTNAVGIIPVIIWVVAIIVTGLVAITYQWSKAFENIQKHKSTLQDRYKAIMSISDDVARNKALQDAANTDNKNLETAAQADAENTTSTGWLGQVKQILVVGLVAYGIKELLPLFTKKK